MLNNRLVVLSGIPGSGKSTYCQAIKDLYESKGVKVNIISSDDIRYELTGKYDGFHREEEVWSIFNNRAYDYSRENDHSITILDATTLTNKQRYLYALRFKNCYKQIYLVVMNTPFEKCLEQNKMRPENKWVPEDVMERMKNRFEPIDRYTCFSYFYSVEYYKPGDRIRFERI